MIAFILKFWQLLSGIFLGWGLGANDASNVFGTGVASNLIKYRNAIILTAVFVIVGALMEGEKTFDTIGKLNSTLTLNTAFIASFAAGLTVFIMTVLKLPISTSQAIVGAILGISIYYRQDVDFGKLTKIFICWVTTPLGAAIISFLLYKIIDFILSKFKYGERKIHTFVKIGVVISGCLGAYSLGANNVANVTGVFVGADMINPFWGTLIGGLSIALGVLTYSKNVMLTVGKNITTLGPLTAFIAVLGQAITVYIFTQIGVPVSTSQAIVGAVAGVGLVKGMQVINMKTIFNIVIGWVSTPVSGALVAMGLCFFIKP
ncbi:MAG: inorganic phosphate transporter [bacterium]|nr:inorganic phosphate transporter [bacterium]